MPRERHARRSSGGTSRAGAILTKINSDIRALNSSILIISQKMRYLVRNEKILGRNLLVLNKKLKEFESLSGKGRGGDVPETLQSDLERINETLSDTTEQLADVRSKVEQMADTFAKAEELKEVKYVVDQLDPLQFVTRKDVEELIEKKLKQPKKAKK